MKFKHFRLYAPRPGDSGSGPTALERGDILPEEQDVDPDNPDETKVKTEEEKAAAELEAKLEAEKDAEAKDPKKDTRIPLSRHEAVLNKEREKRADLERQLAQYQNGQQVAEVNENITALENKVMGLEKEYASLLTDGEVDKATAVMAQIRKAERDMAEAKSDMKIQAAEIRATERVRYGTTLERIESAFPELNPDHDEYDEELMAEVAELKEAYQLKGHTPTVALQKAVKALVEPRTTRQEIATSATPRVSEKEVAAERKADAVSKTAKAVAKTPPSLARTGMDNDKSGGVYDAKSVINLSQKDFAKLSEEELSKLRGDTL